MSFKKTVNLFSDGNCMPVSCRISGGELIPALSFEALRGEVPAGVILAGHSEAVKDFFLFTGEGIYTSTYGNDFRRITGFTGNGPVLFEDITEGKPRAVALNGTKAIYKVDGLYGALYSYGANLTCGVMHCGRLFGADAQDGYKLRWSGEIGYNDWKEGLYGSGHLTLDPERGEILDILEYGEKLVAVRQFGLTVLSMFGSPENFSAEITDTDTDGIYKHTAQVVNGKLIFCTESGLKYFDGSRIGELPHRYARDISQAVCSAVLGGKYFLSCKSRSLGGKAVLCYSGNEESYLINLPADALCSAETIYAYNDSGAFCLSEGGEYSLTCKSINFGTGRYKTVTEIFIDGCADIEISNGKISRKITNAKGSVRTGLRGKEFTVTLTGRDAVRAVTLTAEVCNAI